MAANRFKFVSPGVFINEIDQSQLPALPFGVGPTVIGRFQQGPAMRPVRVGSYAELVSIFGTPLPGGTTGGDVWREGNKLGPTYAAYAAKAWLANNNAINIIRLLGTEHTSAEASGKAGWETDATNPATSGGAYGLFLCNSASAGTAVTGTLAAIWYLNTGSIALSGTRAGFSSTVSGSNVLLKSQGAYSEFKAEIYNAAGTKIQDINFNFSPTDAKFIRKAFNTNPVATNSSVTRTDSNAYKTYWLGETFERSVDEYVTNTATGQVYGFIAPLLNGTNYGAVHRRPIQPAKTGWVFSQDLTTNYASYSAESQVKLFRISTLDSGDWESKNLKIAIEDIKGPRTNFEKYGSFTVAVMSAQQLDSANPVALERFSNLSMDPNSENFIAKRIGDKYIAWSDDEKRYKEYGNYANQSRYIYVEVDQEAAQGFTDPLCLPFGFYGPPRFKSFVVNSGSSTPSDTFVARTAVRATSVSSFLDVSTLNFTGSFLFPSVGVRVSASTAQLSQPTDVYFGLDVTKKSARNEVDYSYRDVLRPPPSAYVNYVASESNREYSFVFSLDDLRSTSTGAVYASGTRVAGNSYTAQTGSYTAVLNAGYDQFVMPLFGGNDGVDVTEAEPFGNHLLTGTPTETTNYVYYTLRRAIDTVADPEVVVTDIITLPGVTKESVTDHLLETCQARGDALGIIDLPNAYIPETESTNSDATRRGTTVTSIASAFKDRSINNSYGAAYYPWVQIVDGSARLWVPPSVVALGALSYGQASSELWFAPAGFTRGGLSAGRGGLPVVDVSTRLTTAQRDALYEVNINPIAKFANEGIVIFGQKTLQATPSALDRINVRRLLIFLKREISLIASTLLFDQNVTTTWNRFKGQVEPLLASVKTRLGLTDYRVVLDSTTTTPDLIDRNILYAKIFLKPARAIEFIVIDFNITRTGASFND